MSTLSQTTTQQHSLSPLRIQTLSLLALPAPDLHRQLAQVAETNPFLEYLPLQSSGPTNRKYTAFSAGNTQDSSEAKDFSEAIPASASPCELLLAQVPDLPQNLKTPLTTLIHSLDDHGFLPPETAERFGTSSTPDPKNFCPSSSLVSKSNPIPDPQILHPQPDSHDSHPYSPLHPINDPDNDYYPPPKNSSLLYPQPNPYPTHSGFSNPILDPQIPYPQPDPDPKIPYFTPNPNDSHPVDSQNNTYDASPEEAQLYRKAYAILRSLSPRGIGACDLQDCLLLQISSDSSLYSLVAHHWEDLLHRRFSSLTRKLHLKPHQLRDLLAQLQPLNLAPLQALTTASIPTRTPELMFQKKDHRWDVEIIAPQLRLQEDYRHLSARSLSPEDRAFFKENRQQARVWIHALRYRNLTLHKIAQHMLHFQQEFLERGPTFLHPQSQKQVAQFLNIHPSTLSRAIQEKYAHTPYGILPLRFFFVHGNRGIFSSAAIRDQIQRLILREDPAHPLSDDTIAQSLQSMGYPIARRTVTKYRSSLSFPNQNARRFL